MLGESRLKTVGPKQRAFGRTLSRNCQRMPKMFRKFYAFSVIQSKEHKLENLPDFAGRTVAIAHSDKITVYSQSLRI